MDNLGRMEGLTHLRFAPGSNDQRALPARGCCASPSQKTCPFAAGCPTRCVSTGRTPRGHLPSKGVVQKVYGDINIEILLKGSTEERLRGWILEPTVWV